MKVSAHGGVGVFYKEEAPTAADWELKMGSGQTAKEKTLSPELDGAGTLVSDWQPPEPSA